MQSGENRVQQPLAYEAVQSLFLSLQSELQRQIKRVVLCNETAADLAQDLFFRLPRIANRLPNETEARRYLFRMASNIALDHRRISRNRARLLLEMTPLQEGYDQRFETDPTLQDELARIESILARQTPRRQAIFRASRLLGMTYAEIATKHGVSPSTVEKEVAAVMRELLVATRADDQQGGADKLKRTRLQ